MKYKLISCEVFMRMACLAVSNTPHVIDLDFTKLGAHEDSASLNAILLGYGLCGNSIEGLKARSTPLIVPRAHDCCTIFLGSKQKFLENFGDNLSSQWSSVGYMERSTDYLRDTDTGKFMGLDKDYEQLVEQYGEENAKYVWETLHPKSTSNEMIFIDVPELNHPGFLDKMRSLAAEENKTLKIIDGDMRIINGLLFGEWNDLDYLYVPPGMQIKALYDQEKVISVDE